MRIIVLLALALTLNGCGDLPSEPSEVQQQQMQRSFYGTGNPSLTNPPADPSTPAHEPVPGEVVPNR